MLSTRLVPVTLSLGRIGVGVAFAAKPASSLRLLGIDAVTAARVDWLARMTAVRDVAIGVGTLGALARRREVSGWLLAGAVCDAGDAAAVAAAASRHKVATVPAVAELVIAAAASALAVGSIAALRRTPDRDHELP